MVTSSVNITTFVGRLLEQDDVMRTGSDGRPFLFALRGAPRWRGARSWTLR